MDLSYLSAVDQARLIAAGEVSAVDITRHALERAHALNPQLNAFACILDEQALADATQLDAEQAAGSLRGPLHGVPIVIKDENDVAGQPTTYGGAAFGTPASADSEVVRRLRAAGAVIIGKTLMPEFGTWPWTESSAHGWTRNPWNLNRSTGGSSGGTAAAVAAGIVAVGIGGDGGGSIRLPSSYCGLLGLKCQRGRTSSAPHADLWHALGVIGPLSRSAADTALVYDQISGNLDTDNWQATPLTAPLAEAIGAQLAPQRIVVSAKNPALPLSASKATKAALKSTADTLRSLGHDVIEMNPRYPLVAASFVIQMMCGISDAAQRAEHPELLESRSRGLRRIGVLLKPLLGWAEKSGVRAGEKFNARFFGNYDLLLTPTTSGTASVIGRLEGKGLVAALATAAPVASYTSIWNVLGNPAAAMPAGLDEQGLPLSVQLIGAHGAESTILTIAAQLEHAQSWAEQRPPAVN